MAGMVVAVIVLSSKNFSKVLVIVKNAYLQSDRDNSWYKDFSQYRWQVYEGVPEQSAIQFSVRSS